MTKNDFFGKGILTKKYLRHEGNLELLSCFLGLCCNYLVVLYELWNDFAIEGKDWFLVGSIVMDRHVRLVM